MHTKAKLDCTIKESLIQLIQKLGPILFSQRPWILLQ